MIIKKLITGIFIFGIFTGVCSQNAPVTVFPIINSCGGLPIDVPVTVSNFVEIGAVSLTLHFEASSLEYISFTNNSNFPGLFALNPNSGVITAAGFATSNGITLPDNAVLFTLHFTFSGGISDLSWFDDGPSCEYAGPPPVYNVLNDVPQQTYYINGLVKELSPPSILQQPVSPEYVQAGSGTASFSVLADGVDLTYQWQEFINSWEDIGEGGVYEGSLSETLNIINPPIEMNGYKYRCVVSGLCDPPVITNGLATLTVINTVNVEYCFDNSSTNKIKINAYPNPFRKRIVLKYYLPSPGNLFIEISDIKGNYIETIINRFETKGNHSLKLTLDHLKPGIYNAQVLLKSNNENLLGTIKIVCRK